MTKEQLVVELTDAAREVSVYRIDGILKKFFSQNVCITKGANRHPYADVYHKYLEDTSIKLESKRNDGLWLGTSISELHEIRIKPVEPVYEWLVLHHQAYIVSDSGRFMTLEETCDGMIPIEETKRIRQ